MASKVEISCDMCDAYFELIHDLEYPYEVNACPFCGEDLGESEDTMYVSYVNLEENQEDEDSFS